MLDRRNESMFCASNLNVNVCDKRDFVINLRAEQ